MAVILNATTASGIQVSSDNSGTVQFQTSGTNTMYVDTSGNVGIGTSSPSAKLQVTGTAWFGSSSAGAIGILTPDPTSGANGVNLSASFATGGYGPLTFSTSNTESMRIDASGNVGIGTTSPSNYGIFSTLGSVSNSNSALGAADATVSTILNTNLLAIGNKATQSFNFVHGKSVVAGYYAAYNGASDIGTGLLFGTQATTAGGTVERMRIDSSGNLLVGTTVSNPGGATYNGQVAILSAGGTTKTGINIATTASTSKAIEFQYTAFGVVGSITTSNTATAYNTSSDYRLKENITPMTTGLEKISALKPVTYDWISDKSAGEGFIAHELAEVVPLAVHGTKDAVDVDGKPVYQGVDYSKVVVHLVAAIQEQQATIASLTARIATLEAK
jgi:hypothetical protein